MQVSKAIKIWLEYHKSNSKRNTFRAYQTVLSVFSRDFGERNLNELASEEILSFLNRMTEGKRQQTKRTRYSHLSAFFNFIRNNGDQNFRNPCDTPMMKKLFRNRGLIRWTIKKGSSLRLTFIEECNKRRICLDHCE